MSKWPRDRYTGPGGGLYTGPCEQPYLSNWPPPHILIKELKERRLFEIVDYLLKMGFLQHLTY